MEIMQSGGELIRGCNEERIYVSVRLRPLSENEISTNDVSDWECINNDTIVHKNVHPSAYTFGKQIWILIPILDICVIFL